MFGRITEEIKHRSGAGLDWLVGVSTEARNVKGQLNRIEEKLKIMADDQKTQQEILAEDLRQIEQGQAEEKLRGEKMIADQESVIQSLQEKQANSGIDLSAEIATAERVLQSQKDSFAASASTTETSDAQSPDASAPEVAPTDAVQPESPVSADEEAVSADAPAAGDVTVS